MKTPKEFPGGSIPLYIYGRVPLSFSCVPITLDFTGLTFKQKHQFSSN